MVNVISSKFGKKMGWAEFWSIFSQTYLVTLMVGNFGTRNNKLISGTF
jgi:hypothetical protein